MGNGNVIRKHKRNNYTTVDNSVLKSKDISLKAKGLLVMLLSFDDNWEFSVSGLTTLTKEGIDSVRSGLEELETQGYLHREQLRDKGKFSKTVYHIYEEPFEEEPITENPISVNPIQQSNNINEVISNKEKLNKKESSFDLFWQAYPKKVSKGQAIKTFNKVVKDEETLNLILKDLERRKGHKDWLKENGQFIPYPSTYLNNTGWEDEYDVDMVDCPL